MTGRYPATAQRWAQHPGAWAAPQGPVVCAVGALSGVRAASTGPGGTENRSVPVPSDEPGRTRHPFLSAEGRTLALVRSPARAEAVAGRAAGQPALHVYVVRTGRGHPMSAPSTL
jgi:hypothetical protein